jgi:hemoglobin
MEEKPTTSVEETLYVKIGGENGVKTLVERFYQIMDTDPKARAVRAVHGPSLKEAQEKLYDFLSGWLGGPPLYLMKHGHPRMRMRHMPFPISSVERDEWLYCMQLAMDECGVGSVEQDAMRAGFRALAFKIQNQGELSDF